MWRGLLAVAAVVATGPETAAATGLRSGVEALGRRVHRLGVEVHALRAVQAAGAGAPWAHVEAEMAELRAEVEKSRATATLLASSPGVVSSANATVSRSVQEPAAAADNDGAAMSDNPSSDLEATEGQLHEVLTKLDSQQAEITNLASMLKDARDREAAAPEAGTLARKASAPGHLSRAHLPVSSAHTHRLLGRHSVAPTGEAAKMPAGAGRAPQPEAVYSVAPPAAAGSPEARRVFEVTSAEASVAIEAAKQAMAREEVREDAVDDDDRTMDPGPPKESDFLVHPLLRQAAAQDDAGAPPTPFAAQEPVPLPRRLPALPPAPPARAPAPAPAAPAPAAPAPEADSDGSLGLDAEDATTLDAAERLLRDDSDADQGSVLARPIPAAPRALLGGSRPSGPRAPWWYEQERSTGPHMLSRAGGFGAHRQTEYGPPVGYGRYRPLPAGYVPTLPPRSVQWYQPPPPSSRAAAEAMNPMRVQPPAPAQPPQPPPPPPPAPQAKPAQPAPPPPPEPPMPAMPVGVDTRRDPAGGIAAPAITSDFFAPPPPGVVAQAPA